MRTRTRLTFDKVTTILCCGLALGLFIGIIISAICNYNQYGEYDYTTASGDTGVAEYCSISHGNLYCREKNGKMVQVESYKEKEE